jgi:hypothetical protein
MNRLLVYSPFHSLRVHWRVSTLAMVLIVAAGIRLFPFVELTNGAIRFEGTCGQLIDEVKPIVLGGNPLKIEYFYYPPVAPVFVASTALITELGAARRPSRSP